MDGFITQASLAHGDYCGRNINDPRCTGSTEEGTLQNNRVGVVKNIDGSFEYLKFAALNVHLKR